MPWISRQWQKRLEPDVEKPFWSREISTTARFGLDGNIPAGCSKRPDFSPAQPWRAETRLVPNKAAASDYNSSSKLARTLFRVGAD